MFSVLGRITVIAVTFDAIGRFSVIPIESDVTDVPMNALGS